MSLWFTIFLAGLATFAIRFSFIGAAGRYAIPAWFSRMLRFVPIAALTALVWPDLLIAPDTNALAPAFWAEPRFLAGLAAAMIAWKTRNVLLTIATGMLLLWGLQWLR